MTKKILILSIFLSIFIILGVPVFADNSSGTSSVQPVPVNPIADQQKEADEISNLAKQSAVLYSQIADIADDKSTQQTKKKMQEVDQVLNDLKRNKEDIVRQMQEEQKEKLEAEEREQQRQLREKAESLYDEGMTDFRTHNETTARIVFLRLENIFPNYKDTHAYLSRIDLDLKKKSVVAMTNFEKIEVKHLNQVQAKQNELQLNKVKQAKHKIEDLESQQEASLKTLAEKAGEINDDIIVLSRQQNYEAVKAKFAELKDIIASMMGLKIQIAKEKDQQEREAQLVRDAQIRRDQLAQLQKLEDRQDYSYGQGSPLKGYPVIPANPNPEADYYKSQEIREEQNKLFDEGVDLYSRQKYTQAKLIFGELADQHDKRAEVWLKKVDRAVTKVLLRSQEAEVRERTAFLEDQLSAQHELAIIQMRERMRQKALSEQFERQKKLLEDDKIEQLRKEELLKLQVRERQLQEERRKQWEKSRQKEQQIFHFRRIQPPALPAKPASAQAPVPSPSAAVVVKPAVSQPVTNHFALTAQDLAKEHENARQIRLNQIEEAKGRRAELRAQRIAEIEARRKAILEAREKIKEDRKKARERQLELRAEAARAKAQQKEMLSKNHQELIKEDEYKRKQEAKQEEISREEDGLQAQFDRHEKQAQDKLELQREAIHKQLEEGIEAMYQEALRLYAQGDYKRAADRFKDIQDIIPGYKQTQHYMDDARQKSVLSPNQNNVSNTLGVVTNVK